MLERLAAEVERITRSNTGAAIVRIEHRPTGFMCPYGFDEEWCKEDGWADFYED